jgi:hypothetical protein
LQNYENSNLTQNLWNLTHIKLIFRQKFTFHTLTLVVSCTKSLEKDAKLLLKADKIISNGSIYEYTNKKKLYMIIRRRLRVIVHSDDENDDEISEENSEIGREFQENHNQSNQIQIEETYSTQSQIGRASLACKALNQDIEIVRSKA